MISCLIVDDEAPAREELKFLIEEFEDVNVVGLAKHGLEAIELNSKLNPDLIFLDIEMPKIGGIEVADTIIKSGYNPIIVFVTAYDEFALKAFEVNAIDYLLKPIIKERLNKTINKIRTMKNNISRNEYDLSKLLTEMKEKNSNINKITLYKDGTLIPLRQDEIVYATVELKQTIIISTRGRYEYPNTLSCFEEKMNSKNFFRSHRSFLINLDFIEKIEPWFNSTFIIKMKNCEDKIPVSRGQAKEFKKIMNIT